jgi:hypothetical protein
MGGVDKRELVIEDDALRAVDPDLRALHDVNAPEDMSP